MKTKNLYQFGVVVLLVVASLYFIFNFVSGREAKDGVLPADNHVAFQSVGDAVAILYGKKTCPYCRQAVAELEALNIKFIYKNIKESPEALSEFAALKGNAIPLLITRDLRIVGFNKQWYTKAVLLNNDLSNLAQPGNPDL